MVQRPIASMPAIIYVCIWFIDEGVSIAVTCAHLIC